MCEVPSPRLYCGSARTNSRACIALTPVSLCSSGRRYPSMGHDLDQKKVTLTTEEHGTKNNWGQKRAVFVSLFSLRLALIRSGWISLPLVFGRDRLYTSSRANQLLIR